MIKAYYSHDSHYTYTYETDCKFPSVQQNNKTGSETVYIHYRGSLDEIGRHLDIILHQKGKKTRPCDNSQLFSNTENTINNLKLRDTLILHEEDSPGHST